MASDTAKVTSQSDVFSLMRLAPDIQYAIFQSLCYHCASEDDAMGIMYHDPCEQTQTLRNLCLASRHTKSLAQNILYHFPRIYSYSTFFRTIYARPDLASQVKVMTWVYKEDVSRFLYPSRFNPDRDLTPREDIWYLRSLAVELKLQDTESQAFAKTFAEYPKSADDDVDENFKQEMHKAFDNLITSIIWGLCPRLEFASVNLEDGREFPCHQPLPIEPVRFQYLPGLVVQRAGSFPSIRTLVIQNTIHNDPNILGIGSVSFLWKSLPNLQRLIFFRGFSEAYPDEPSPPCNDQLDDALDLLRCLKELRFVRYSRYERPLPLPAITDLVSKCTQLQHFAFSPMGLEEGVFPPLQLVRAISAASDSLRQLIINCPILETSAVDAAQLITDLRQFTQLQNLVLDQSVFCRHHHHPNTDTPPNCLTNMLPTSICSLTINTHSPCAPVVDLIALGTAVANGNFIHLRHLRIQMIFVEVDESALAASDSDMNNPALLALREKLSEIEKSPWSFCKEHIRQMISKAFEATSVVLDLDSFSGSLYEPSNQDGVAPHSMCWRFCMSLIQDEL